MLPTQRKHGVRASFVIAVTCAFLSSILNIISFVSPYWIVAKYGNNQGFQRLGLWEVCFHNFIFPEDYVSKAYEGCWYIYYPEYKYIRFWLNPPWLYACQILSIIGLICSLLGLLFVILTLCEIYGTRERKPKITIICLEATSLCCTIVIITAVGVMSKDREWMPRSDYNEVSWGFAFAVLSGFATVFCLFGLLTHFLSVESRIKMEDPSVRQKLLDVNAKHGYPRSVSGFDVAAATDSKLGGGVPSLFTMPPTGSQFGPGSTMIVPGTASALSRGTVAPGAVGTAAQGTSAATVSAKLRQSLEAQQAAILAANARAAESGGTGAGSSATYQQNIRRDPGSSSSLNRQYPPISHQGSYTHLHPAVAMDSTV
ncbi:hypothetical protein T265_11372 [Opisthorchis viverrini]|uniref:Uncharacterized protein n=1 Tax=Opisthorchis viverrini TaxID=6198 RepID=A0A074YZ79_OPIVI|nr:hypothetical protein T265_11372 [Opisthorchis viverrini]KER19983.1 hypothetical protein T265_11372 [Opisthorchis viverrini]